MMRCAAILTALTLVLSTAFAAGPKRLDVTLKGSFVVSDGDAGVAFKAGGKTFAIDLHKVRLQRHRVEKLKDLPAGTRMFVFATYKEWSDGDEFERVACLVAGEHLPPEYNPKSANMRRWYTGGLRFAENKSIAYVDSASLPTGVERPTCVIEVADFSLFFENKKDGKRVAKPAYVRGRYAVKVVDGKEEQVFVPQVITLPTRGLPAKEYEYILDPGKMYEDLEG